MEIDLLDDLDLIDSDLIEGESNIHSRGPNKIRIRRNPFEDSDEDFRNKYRFSKSYAARIVDLIRDQLTSEPRGCNISPQIQVTCALRNWARHEIQDDSADLHGISQPSVSIICKNVAEALARLAPKYIQMPPTLTAQEENMHKFRAIANFPTVIGAIDCTHIKIKKVNEDGGQTYINRKGYASLNVQVVCNADLKIMDIVARWRGSVHDSRIFRDSRLKQRFEAGAFSGILLGDSGYPCTHYLFTPVLNPHTRQQENYNAAHIRTRNTIERCFGVLKQRFRCLLRGMFGSIETAKKTIVAIAVLHNIAIDMKEDLPFNEGTEPMAETAQNYVQQNTVRGNVRRRLLIETHF